MTDTSYFVTTLARGLSVMSAFSEDTPSLSLTEIAHKLNLNKTTVLRLASTLQELGFLERDERTRNYRLGRETMRLGFVVLNNLEVRQVARPYLQHLAEKTGEMVNLSVLDGAEVVYIDRVRSRHLPGISLEVGTRLPAYCTSAGKAHLAYLAQPQLAQTLAATSWEARTPFTPTNAEALLADLARVRQRGYAVNAEELSLGMCAVAAPIFSGGEAPVAAVDVTMFSGRDHFVQMEQEHAPRVVQTARDISSALGHHFSA